MFILLTKILEGFAVLKWKFGDKIERRRGDFYNPSNEGLGPFSLPFTKGSRSLNVGNQTLGGKWGGGMSPRTHLLKPLERLFHFRLNFIFWLARAGHKIDTLGGVFCFLECPRTPKSQTGCPRGHPKILQGCPFYTQKKFRVSPVLVGPISVYVWQSFCKFFSFDTQKLAQKKNARQLTRTF